MQHLNDPKPEEDRDGMFDGMKKMFTSNRDSYATAAEESPINQLPLSESVNQPEDLPENE